MHHNRETKKVECTHGGTRTPNLRFRRPTPYPLGHAGEREYIGKVSDKIFPNAISENEIERLGLTTFDDPSTCIKMQFD